MIQTCCRSYFSATPSFQVFTKHQIEKPKDYSQQRQNPAAQTASDTIGFHPIISRINDKNLASNSDSIGLLFGIGFNFLNGKIRDIAVIGKKWNIKVSFLESGRSTSSIAG